MILRVRQQVGDTWVRRWNLGRFPRGGGVMHDRTRIGRQRGECQAQCPGRVGRRCAGHAEELTRERAIERDGALAERFTGPRWRAGAAEGPATQQGRSVRRHFRPLPSGDARWTRQQLHTLDTDAVEPPQD